LRCAALIHPTSFPVVYPLTKRTQRLSGGIETKPNEPNSPRRAEFVVLPCRIAKERPLLSTTSCETPQPFCEFPQFRAVELDFALDSSGFRSSRFVRWFDHKYGKPMQEHDWVKVSLMTGVKTNIAS
jgi:hypothetical protein